MQAAAYEGMHVRKLLASLRRIASFAVHVAHADHFLRGLTAAAEGVEAASSSAGIPYPPTALFTRAMQWATSVPVLARAAREAQLVTSTCCVFSVA
jgi:hypothetical protein